MKTFQIEGDEDGDLVFLTTGNYAICNVALRRLKLRKSLPRGVRATQISVSTRAFSGSRKIHIFTNEHTDTYWARIGDEGFPLADTQRWILRELSKGRKEFAVYVKIS